MVEVELKDFFFVFPLIEKVFLCLNYKTKLFNSILDFLNGNKGRVGYHL